MSLLYVGGTNCTICRKRVDQKKHYKGLTLEKLQEFLMLKIENLSPSSPSSSCSMTFNSCRQQYIVSLVHSYRRMKLHEQHGSADSVYILHYTHISHGGNIRDCYLCNQKLLNMLTKFNSMLLDHLADSFYKLNEMNLHVHLAEAYTRTHLIPKNKMFFLRPLNTWPYFQQVNIQKKSKWQGAHITYNMQLNF